MGENLDPTFWTCGKNLYNDWDDMGTYYETPSSPPRKQLKITIFGAASDLISKKNKKIGYAVGKDIAKAGHIMLFGAGRTGMMGAVARGYMSQSPPIRPFGATTTYIQAMEGQFQADHINTVVAGNMAARKELYWLSDVMLIMPGGIGTLDELFEFMVMKKLGQWHGRILIWGEGWVSDLLKKLLNQLDSQHLADRPNDLVEFVNFKRLKEIL